MGSSSSHPAHQDMGYNDQHQPNFMDMNALFRDGIPKMIKVADDMHRMTNYIMDLRNMTLGLVAISAIGVLGFLILRFMHGRSRRKRRTSRHHIDDGPHAATLPRYYNYQSQYAPEPWDRPKSTFSHHSIEDKKLHDTHRGSPEDHRQKQPPNGNIHTYKPYTPVGPPTEHDSSDESRGGGGGGTMNDSFPSSRATTTVPNPMLITQAATPPPLSQKVAFTHPCTKYRSTTVVLPYTGYRTPHTGTRSICPIDICRGRSSRSSSWSRTSRTPTRTISRQDTVDAS
ncbi:hypothetical protein PFISCL1PPCAC_23108, partial [Pristionchus fissidentatus]